MMILKKISLSIVLQLLFVAAFAQKLPLVQQVSLRAPATIKIDGKPVEWPVFQAYNNKVDLFYTIANDSDNVYLILKSNNKMITSKILEGGLKFAVKGTDKNDIVITYPVLDSKRVKSVYKLMPKVAEDNLIKEDEKEAVIKRNLALNTSKKEIIKLFKFIGISGLKGVQDPEITIYNNLGIKVSSSIDISGAYICEFELPLKYVTNSLKNLKSIQYSVRILAKKVPDGFFRVDNVSVDGSPPLGDGGVDLRSFRSDTFFWGEYTLAK